MIVLDFLRKIPGWLYAAGTACIGIIFLLLRIRGLKNDNTVLESKVETAVQAEKQAEQTKAVVQEVLVAKTEETEVVLRAAQQAAEQKEAVEQETEKQRVVISLAAAQIPQEDSSIDDIVAAFNKSHHKG